MLMKIFCTASKLGTALFLVHLHFSRPPSSSLYPTSSGSNVSQDYISQIEPHNKLFWAGRVQEIYLGKSSERQRRTAGVSNGLTFSVWLWACALDQSVDNILQHHAKGNNGSLDPCAALVSANPGRADPNSFQPHAHPKMPKNFFILCPWLSMAIIQHLHLSHWRQISKILTREIVRKQKTICHDIRWVIPYQRLSKHTDTVAGSRTDG